MKETMPVHSITVQIGSKFITIPLTKVSMGCIRNDKVFINTFKFEYNKQDYIATIRTDI